MTISHVPVLGPLDYDERCLEEETVTRGLNTHRASMHFRNYWFYNKDNFEAFADLLKQTWPGMTISPPEIFRGTNATLFMMCNEHKLAREIFWAGFGFQVWCQLLTHMCRSHDADLLIADEPEIYLHPDLQRQLIHHLRELGPDIVIATHSSEIVNEAEPRDILLIQKDKRTAQRIKNPHKVQQAFDLLGSSLNVTLTQLARNRRIVFVEGTDFTVLRRFARRVGKIDLANGTGITFLPLGGFTGWPRLKAMAWAFQEALGEKIRFGAVFDRDFRCDEEINKIKSEIGEGFDFVHFHSSKEIENYLLLPSALDRAISATIRDRVKRNHKAPSEVRGAIQILNDVSEEFHDTTQGQ